MHGHMNVK